MTPFALTVIVALVAADSAAARYPHSPTSQAERLLDATIDVMNVRRNGPAFRCIERNREFIIASAIEGERRFGTPPGILYVVGMAERHLGCGDLTGRSNWGSPASRAQRQRNGTPLHAARDLATSRRRCGSWESGLFRYRFGLCGRAPRNAVGYSAQLAAHLIRRVYHRAGIDLPEDFPRPTGLRVRTP